MTKATPWQHCTSPSLMSSGGWLPPEILFTILSSTELITSASVLDLHMQPRGRLGLSAASDAPPHRCLTLHHCARPCRCSGAPAACRGRPDVPGAAGLASADSHLQLLDACTTVCQQHILSLELLCKQEPVLCRRSPILRCTCRMGGGYLGLTLRSSRTSTCARPGGLLRYLEPSPCSCARVKQVTLSCILCASWLIKLSLKRRWWCWHLHSWAVWSGSLYH